MKTAVIAIAKLENNYIMEWTEWYKNIGFTNVIIYDNNDVDGERISDVLGDYIEDGFAIVEPFYGKKHAQHDAYQMGYDKYGKSYDWIAFFDIDEYLSLSPQYKVIDDYLSAFHPLVDLIRVSWKMYGDNGLLRVTDGDYSIVNRFKEPAKNSTKNGWTKAIVRGGLNLVIGKDDDATPHLVRAGGVRLAVDANGRPVPNLIIQGGCGYENVALNHYSTKTIEEYVLNKVKKGWANNLSDDILNIDLFFEENERTDEKVEIYEQLTGKKALAAVEIQKPDERAMNDKIDIFVITHKNFETERTNPVYKIVCSEDDDVSSDKLEVIKVKPTLSNIGWSEWQKIYEIYKGQVGPLKDYVGLAHYHRYLKFAEDVNYLPSPDELDNIFGHVDIITKFPAVVQNLREQYEFCHNVKDFDIMMDIIRADFPDWYDIAINYTRRGLIFDSNIMILRKDNFLKMCDFVFSVLFKYCERVGIDRTSDESFVEYVKNHEGYDKIHKENSKYNEQARICSYLAERLTIMFMARYTPRIKMLKMIDR